MASRILCCNTLLNKFADFGQLCLERFVLLSKYVYGFESLTINMHNLIHAFDDARLLGFSLSDVTAFSFENELF